MHPELYFIYDSHCPWSYAATPLVNALSENFPELEIHHWHCAHYDGSDSPGFLQIKEVEKGAGIGYNWKYVSPKKMKIAVVPVGYADIIPRSASDKLNVYINGTRRKILGTISMDQIIVESNDNDKALKEQLEQIKEFNKTNNLKIDS